MDEVSVVVPSSTNNNLSSREWLLGAVEEDSSAAAVLSVPLDGYEGGLFAGHFVPPPPRPLFLDEGVTTDGLTTCDLCSWAWQNGGNAHNAIDASLDAPGELGWVLTLVIVSLISAVVGAIVMIVVLHCKRLKNTGLNEQELRTSLSMRLRVNRPPISTPDDKTINTINTISQNYATANQANINGVWSWLSRRSTATPSQLDNPPSSFVENHYTHMEDAYNCVGDALYAELDVESTVDRDSNSPAYQNSAYTDPDAPTSSAPSSAYYSDLSITTVPDRAYEVVGLATMPVWDAVVHPTENKRQQPAIRLAAISENVTVPSDYV